MTLRNTNKKKYSKKKCFILIVTVIYIVMLLMNFLTPLLADDIEYIYKTHGFTRIFQDEYLQYMTWTGRSVVHIIARIFLLLPKPLFNFFNAAAYIYLTLIILQITKLQQRVSSTHYLFINICIWLFIPTFGQVFLWETGAANYLWGSIIMLSFLYTYHVNYLKYFESHSIAFALFMFVFGIIAGWCNENTSGGTLLLVLFYIILSHHKNKTWSGWLFSGLAGNVIGLVIMASAPGNKIRASYFSRNDLSLYRKITTGIVEITSSLYQQRLVFFLVLFMMLSVSFLPAFKKYFMQEKRLLSIGYIFSGLATIYVLSVSPAGVSWSRSYYGGVLFLIIGMSFLWPANHSDVISKSLYPIIITSFTVILTFNVIFGFNDVMTSYHQIKNRYTYILMQKKLGNLRPVVGTIDTDSRTAFPAFSTRLTQLKPNSTAVNNIANAKYFGVDSITAVSENDWEKIYRYGNTSLMATNSFEEYLNKIINSSKYTILISGLGSQVKLSDVEQTLLAKLIPRWTNFKNNSWSISGISSKDKKGFDFGTTHSEYLYKKGKLSVELESGNGLLKTQQFSHILIQNYNYSRNENGLNFVIYDNNEEKVVDAVTFQCDKKGFGSAIR